MIVLNKSLIRSWNSTAHLSIVYDDVASIIEMQISTVRSLSDNRIPFNHLSLYVWLNIILRTIAKADERRPQYYIF